MPLRRYMSGILSKLRRQVTATMSWRAGDKLHVAAAAAPQLLTVEWAGSLGTGLDATSRATDVAAGVSSLHCNQAFARECRQSNAALPALPPPATRPSLCLGAALHAVGRRSDACVVHRECGGGPASYAEAKKRCHVESHSDVKVRPVARVPFA